MTLAAGAEQMKSMHVAALLPLLLAGCASLLLEGRDKPVRAKVEEGTARNGPSIDKSDVPASTRNALRDSIRPLPSSRVTLYSPESQTQRRAQGPAMDGLVGSDGNVEFYIFDMGQADAMLVVGPPPSRKTLLIDVGEQNWNSRAGCNHVRDRVFEITGGYQVDYLVVSHFHLDHIGGVPKKDDARWFEGGGVFCLLNSTPDFFMVGTLVDSGRSDARFQPDAKYTDALDAGVSLWTHTGTLGQRIKAELGVGQIDLGQGVEVEVVVTDGRVPPDGASVHEAVRKANPDAYDGRSSSPNDFSVGLEISVGDFELFTAGDLTGAPGASPYADFEVTQHHQVYTNIESPLAASWAQTGRESDVEVYRVNHHGSGNSSTNDLLSLLRPEVAIYSCGGKYGHPHKDIADRIFALGADQLVTSRIDWDRENDIFPEKYGNGWNNPVGEVRIVVPVGGSDYTISTDTQAWTYLTLSDEGERGSD